MTGLAEYAEVVGPEVVEHLHQLARPLEGRRVVHVNSTREGGGVAEILHRLVPLLRELGVETSWEVIEGDEGFFQCTKGFHNALQGNAVALPDGLVEHYRAVNHRNAERLGAALQDADVVFVHDPQPAALIDAFPRRSGIWVWRCHIDASHPYRPAWKVLAPLVRRHDASVFSLPSFARRLDHPQYIVPPSIDPLSVKNRPLPEDELDAVCARFGLDRARPLVVQVSRFDRFKDPLGVIRACALVRRHVPVQLVLVGGSATDDPEGAAVLDEVRALAAEHEDAHVLVLPPDAHHEINALQRAADVVLQKSIREGFGLTVTEAMWKGKPVIGGDTGGIRLQVVDHHTGFLVSSPEGAALRIRYLLAHPERRRAMGQKARGFVRRQFLLTRHLREYLSLMVALRHGDGARIAL